MTDLDAELIETLGSYAYDPLGFVRWAFPWGEPGELARHREPYPWQCAYLEEIGDRLRLGQPVQMATTSGHGTGKAQPVTTIIETPVGPRRMGDLQVGDLVFGADGGPIRVTGIRRWPSRPTYRIRLSDGSSTLADENHLWSVRGRKERRNNRPGYRQMTTKEILEAGVVRANGSAVTRQWELPQNGPVQYPRQDLPLSPYVMGAWLGDGSKGTGAITSADPDLFDYIRALGYRVSENDRNTSTGPAQTLTILGIKEHLPKCTTYDARVPPEYLRADFMQRLELLRGLLDTDGWVDASGPIMFGSVSKGLAYDVLFLARSLGIVARWNGPKKTTHADFYRVSMTAPLHLVPFNLLRKIEALIQPEARYLKRWIDHIERVGDQDTVCIEVDAPDHLYLTENFIPTHNSALNGMETWWAFSTAPGTRGVITANTENQLKTKTWVEMAKWHRLFIAKHLFKYTATALFSVDETMAREWRIDMVPWSEKNTEAFAGLHNAGGRLLILFDEASAIPDVIWETTEGALTDEGAEIIWSVKGNPTRNKGRFRECFPGGKFAHRWSSREINALSVPGTNKQQLQAWLDDYGEDSDFARIRIFGRFPRSDQSAFIPLELAREAAKRPLPQPDATAPVILGVDVARFGTDASVIYPRQGIDARSRTPLVLHGLSTVELVERIAQATLRWNAEQIFIDEGGVGGGVVDLALTRGLPVIGVQFGGSPSGANPEDPFTKYANKRAEMWGALRAWLRRGCIVDDLPGREAPLSTELAGPSYDYQRNTDKLVLEAKADMARRGETSPDVADALALTFAYPVLSQVHRGWERPAIFDYDPFSPERLAS